MGNLTLAQAKKRAAQAFAEAKELVQERHISVRRAGESLVGAYFGISRRLSQKARPEFEAWFKAEHEKTGKELGAK